MAATVAEAAGPQLAAAATDALAGSLGRGPAHELVAGAVRSARESGRSLADVLAEAGGLDAASLRTPPDVGEAGAQVDDVLAAHRSLTEGSA
jgi:3-carboxy-cis,cis-muconate cycloisomerase